MSKRRRMFVYLLFVNRHYKGIVYSLFNNYLFCFNLNIINMISYSLSLGKNKIKVKLPFEIYCKIDSLRVPIGGLFKIIRVKYIALMLVTT